MEIQKYQPTYASILLSADCEPETKIAVFVDAIKQPIPPKEIYLVTHDVFPTINKLKHTCGTEVLFSCIFAVIDDMIKDIAVDQPSGDKVGNIVVEIIKDYPTYKLEDIREFALEFKKGKYGPVFGRLDIMTIFTALKKYDQERNEIFEAEMLKKSRELNATAPIVGGVEQMHKLYDQVVKQSEERHQKRLQEIEREKQARIAWHDALSKSAESNGVDLGDVNSDKTKNFVKEYMSKYPLSKDYIKNYKL